MNPEAGCMAGITVSQVIELDVDYEEDSEEINRYQLIANMDICAADMGFWASKRFLIYNKITMYGMLVDYKTAAICKVYKATLDFTQVSSTLVKCDTNLQIHIGLSHAISNLKRPLARR